MICDEAIPSRACVLLHLVFAVGVESKRRRVGRHKNLLLKPKEEEGTIAFLCVEICSSLPMGRSSEEASSEAEGRRRNHGFLCVELCSSSPAIAVQNLELQRDGTSGGHIP
jgi:hypothetical protein